MVATVSIFKMLLLMLLLKLRGSTAVLAYTVIMRAISMMFNYSFGLFRSLSMKRRWIQNHKHCFFYDKCRTVVSCLNLITSFLIMYGSVHG